MKQYLDEESRKAIVKYRNAKSDMALKEADVLAQTGLYDSAVTRLYYACYYITCALLIKNGIEATTHVGVKRMLSLKFVVSGLLDRKYINIYSNLLNGRKLSDYEDFIYQTSNSFTKFRDEATDYCVAIKALINREIKKDSD